ncbi:mechanosensitive ion channel [Dissulfurirhabdus thermomarina]|uniref:Mechanosensitive ion channel n=1 Tax=Dissulfurirhabdus thermomarina TaxID=1765737 RepID=A0A6N9TMD6_DISTH|nr:mechanosensitive ion channel domain-containing protein [Dissulfurirhabdus thermomarina]NDY42451.1 mechanosensitive ion channel [Dissulfurirhabdus thermomarina]
MCLLGVLLAGAAAPPAFAAEPTRGPGPGVPAFPGLDQVVPAATEARAEAAKAKAEILRLHDLRDLERQLDELKARYDLLEKGLAEQGDPAGWSVDRLLDFQGRLEAFTRDARRVLDQVSDRLAELEAIRRAWSDRGRYFRDWEAHLRGSGLRPPPGVFPGVRRAVAGVLADVRRAAVPLVDLQTRVSTVLEAARARAGQLDAVITALRRQTFRKNAPSLFGAKYWRQFTPELRERALQGLVAAARVDLHFLERQGWMIGVQVLVLLALGLFIRRHRDAAGAPEWGFVLDRPWSTAFFLTLAAFSIFYQNPPAFWRLAVWFAGVASGIGLVFGLVRNPYKRAGLVFLAGVLLFSVALQIVSLPLPLYRLYLVAVSLAGVPFFLVLARNNDRFHGGGPTGYARLLRAGALLLGSALAAQCAGWSVLGARLVEATAKSVFLCVFTAMLIRIGRGGIGFLTGRILAARPGVTHRIRQGLEARLRQAFTAVVSVVAFLYFLQVWGLYESPAKAWAAVMGLGVSYGGFSLDLRAVLAAVLALYLAFLGSWGAQAFLEAEVFPRRRLDRGVRDSIRRLLHYALVIVGFVMALGFLGVEMQHFVVLAGALGIGIGFGLQNVVNNFVSGLILLFERPIKVGDTIVQNGEWAVVRRIGMRSTVVETYDQSEIIIPNSQLVSETVVNWTLSTSRARVTLPVGVAYGSDTDEVMRILLEAAAQHPAVLPEPKPYVVFRGFGESSLDFELRCWIGDANRRVETRSDLGLFVDRRFREEGVVVPFPQRDLHLVSVAPEAGWSLRGERNDETGPPVPVKP